MSHVAMYILAFVALGTLVVPALAGFVVVFTLALARIPVGYATCFVGGAGGVVACCWGVTAAIDACGNPPAVMMFIIPGAFMLLVTAKPTSRKATAEKVASELTPLLPKLKATRSVNELTGDTEVESAVRSATNTLSGAKLLRGMRAGWVAGFALYLLVLAPKMPAA